jgi:hypothetical protein
VQHIAPRQDVIGDAGSPEHIGCGIPVYDMQHGLSRSRPAVAPGIGALAGEHEGRQ